jgi:glycine cleavage system H protein
VDVAEDLRYTSDHEWVRRKRDDRLVVGVTDFAHTSLSDVVYLELPKVGTSAAAKGTLAEIESVKTATELCLTGAGQNGPLRSGMDLRPRAIEPGCVLRSC